jgi:hypothetical protein
LAIATLSVRLIAFQWATAAGIQPVIMVERLRLH